MGGRSVVRIHLLAHAFLRPEIESLRKKWMSAGRKTANRNAPIGHDPIGAFFAFLAPTWDKAYFPNKPFTLSPTNLEGVAPPTEIWVIFG